MVCTLHQSLMLLDLFHLHNVPKKKISLGTVHLGMKNLFSKHNLLLLQHQQL